MFAQPLAQGKNRFLGAGTSSFYQAAARVMRGFFDVGAQAFEMA